MAAKSSALKQQEMYPPFCLKLVFKHREIVSHFKNRLDVEIELAAGQVVLCKEN
jgi:hypothetical protein